MNQIDKVEKEVKQFQDALKSNQALRDVVCSPIINKKVMAANLKAVSESMKFTPATVNFLELLAENGKLKKIDAIVNLFKSIMAAHRGEVVCEIITAKPLDAGQKKQLEDALKVWFSKLKLFHSVYLQRILQISVFLVLAFCFAEIH